MAKGKKGKSDDGKSIEKMNEKDLIIETVNLLTTKGATYEQRRKIYEYTLKVMSEPNKPEPEDEE